MILDFFGAAEDLKGLPRRGWISKLGIGEPESVADHSYAVGLMSVVLSDVRGLDTAKVARMSLLHDLAESRVGDLTPGEMPEREKGELEDAAMGEILRALPEPARGRYGGAWEEFRASESREARLVHDVDKLEMALQAGIYSKRAAREKIEVFFESARSSVRDDQLKGMLDAITSR